MSGIARDNKGRVHVHVLVYYAKHNCMSWDLHKNTKLISFIPLFGVMTQIFIPIAHANESAEQKLQAH